MRMCSECSKPVPAEAETCGSCGYPVLSSTEPHEGDLRSSSFQRSLDARLYKRSGCAVMAIGILAIIADAPAAGSASFLIGAAIAVLGVFVGRRR